MGRYVGNVWHEELPSLSAADQVRGNNVPVPSGGGGGGLTPSGTTSTGEVTYNTVNGPRTLAQMNAELRAVGWPGPTYGGGQESTAQAIANAYAQTTGGGVSLNQGSVGSNVPSAPGQPTPTPQVNLDAQSALFNAANQAALIAYYNAKLALDTDELAFRKATQAFQNTISEAQVTGTYQGAPTLAAQNQYAQLFGTYGVPTPGQQTLAAQQQAAQLSGYYQGAPTLARQAQEQQAAQQYLSLLSNLRGPADYFQYQKVLGATPGGLQDLVRAAAGQYIPGVGSGTTGVAPQPVSLAGFVNQATGTPAQNQATLQSLVPPNQMAPQTWNAIAPSQQQLLLGAWESQGYNRDDALNLFRTSLPRYATGPNTGTFRLQ